MAILLLQPAACSLQGGTILATTEVLLHWFHAAGAHLAFMPGMLNVENGCLC
jgi:hypothetical protein